MQWNAIVFALQVCLLFCSFPLLEAAEDSSQCSASDCGGCIRAGSQCHWCLDTNFTLGANSGRRRCDVLSAFNTTCNSTTADIQTVDAQLLENNEFGDEVQIRPQVVEIALRPGQPATFDLNIKPAQNFPVDIYYLMDVSLSMRDDLANLQTLGDAIGNEIKKITTKYRFAFGSFVDKHVVPYIQPEWLHADFPCSHPFIKENGVNCRPVFSYIHFLNFTQNATAFEETVRNQAISGDADGPEGGFDGLMQAAACEEELGWQEKEKARRIVIYVTDAPPKIAGDAKLAGLVTPNDGKCHIAKQYNGEIGLNASSKMDYPSIGHLKAAMLRSQIVPIIAVTKDVIPIYSAIKDAWIDLGAAIGELNQDSSNIVQLIAANYAKISSTARIVAEVRDNLKISYKLGNCPQGDPSIPDVCPNILKSQNITFKVTIDALKCPTDSTKRTEEFKIRTGFGDMTVKVKYLCDCSCESKSVLNSPLCSTNGTYECGICKCNAGRYGTLCQCDQKDLGNEGNNTVACTGPDNTTCSNNGNCVCGKCECFQQDNILHKITGPFCECKNFGCPTFQGLECGGNGNCDCGKCLCYPKYNGSSCGSKICDLVIKEKCTGENGKICNGNGVCDCQNEVCVCKRGFGGPKCEKCVLKDCNCAEFQDCVLCGHFDRKNVNCSGCEGFTFKEVDEIDGERCTLQLNESCLVYYSLKESYNQTIYVINKLFCTAVQAGDNPDLLAIILGIIAGILLLGLLLLLLWKLLTHIHDKRDYEKFKTSQQSSQWEKGGNPIYREPNQQFENPAFAGNN